MKKQMHEILLNFEVWRLWTVQKFVNLVDLVKSFPTNTYYLLAKIGVDTPDENEPLNFPSTCKRIYMYGMQEKRI